MTDQDLLDTLRNAITALGLGQCAPEELVAEARASSSRREQDRGTLADQRARIKELEGKIASNVTEAAARDMRIADLERDLAAKDEAFTRVNTTLNDLSDFMRAVAPDVLPPWSGADVLRAVDAVYARATQAESTIAEITAALADAGAPRAYRIDDDTERPIPDPERVRLLGERVHTLRAQLREITDATNYLDAIVEGHNALDALSAPRLADGCVLSLAARIRSLPH